VRGVIGLSVPYRPRGSTRPLPALRSLLGAGFYMVYCQEPGIADAELARDLPATSRRLLYAASGAAPPLLPVVPPGGGLLDVCPNPPSLPYAT
jgi:epoxide hydrolase A/B